MSGERPVGDGSGEAGAAADGEAEQAAADGELIEDAEPQPLVIRKRGRRASTEPSPGYTGEPATERTQSTENDARIWGDLPPHWGKR
ncbi:hypothetical protein [Agrococcus baldri]|uniref:Uncharacterized protein n=1 Tax=Agrococcus baldri TaxID=153730 RepID=A0AA87RFH3_9MICO|nr:hypothetical protein [Agrococcus baldri]GEK79734.1 hypothetical protein ABA31_10850 [Agrococcus baldri]